MDNLRPTGAPPAGIHPREALRELCAIKRHDRADGGSRPASARGPSPYAFWHNATVERQRGVSPPRNADAVGSPSPQPAQAEAQRTPFGARRPLSAVASRLSTSRNERSTSASRTSPTRTSPQRAGEARPAPYVPTLALKVVHTAQPLSARAPRPTTAPSARGQPVGAATARASRPSTSTVNKPAAAATEPISTAPRPPTEERPSAARPPRPHTAAVSRPPEAAQKSPAEVAQMPPLEAAAPAREGKLAAVTSPVIGEKRSPVNFGFPGPAATSSSPPTSAIATKNTSGSSAGVAFLQEGGEMSASGSRRSRVSLPGDSSVRSASSGIRVSRTVEDFMHSDDDVDGAAMADTASPLCDASASTAPPVSRFQSGLKPTGKAQQPSPMGSDAPLSCSTLPAAPNQSPPFGASGSLVNYLHDDAASNAVDVPALRESPDMSSAASSQRRDRPSTASRSDWSRKPGAAATSRSSRRPNSGSGRSSATTVVGFARESMSESQIARRAQDHWRALIGYIHVKKAIRRWREDFQRRLGGLGALGGRSRSMGSLKSSVFSPRGEGETAEDVIAGFDNFDWIVTFSVPCVLFRGTPLDDANVHISTTHIHFSTNERSTTVRLSDVLGVSPSGHGLTIKLAPLAGGKKRSIAEITEITGKEPKRMQRRRSFSANALQDQDNTVEIETEEGNYIALHIFDFQSRILRSYATSLSKTLTERMARALHVVHFNDVYHLPPFKPATARGVVGGASRFHTVLKEIRENYNPLVLFSGDFMGPSLMSVITKGKQMIDALNFLGVHYGCYGNHEFDYGLKTLKEVIFGYTQGKHIYTGSQTTWIMSNMTEGDSDVPLGGAKKVEIFIWNGVRVGLLGLCENWIPQCNQLRPGEAEYIDIFETGESMAQRLKDDEGCELVLALTHNRLNIDKELMAKCPSIDFLLGGHDHFYKSDPKSRVLKSGQEFEYLSFVEFAVNEDRRMGRVKIDTRPIMYDTPQSDYMKGLIERYDQKLKEKLGKPIGTSAIPLDSTEETIRFKEGLLPNFILDIMEDEAEADFAVLGAAAIAGKEVKPPGPVTIGDVFGWFPNDTRIMKMKVKGSTVRKMLDVMVRELPAEAPSFPHPSRSLSFTINMIFLPPRVDNVCIKGKPVVDDEEYSVAVEEFVGVGKAKYKFVPIEGETLVNDENASQLVHWVMDFFTKHKGTEKSPESQARDEALKTVSKVVAHAARIEIDADVEKSQKFVRSVITELLKCDRSSVFLVDSESGDLTFIPDGAPSVIRIPKGIGIAGCVAVNNEEFNIADVYEDPRFNRKIDLQTGYRTRSMLAIPVSLEEGKVIAVVQAINKDPEINGGIFDEVDILKLRLLGEQVGFQLRNSEIFREARSNALAAEAVAMMEAPSPRSSRPSTPGSTLLAPHDQESPVLAGMLDDPATATAAHTPLGGAAGGIHTTLSSAFDGTTLQQLSPLTDHMVATFKAFATEVSLSAQTMLEMVTEYAIRLIPCDFVRVFVRDASGENVITIVDDVEDDETVTTWEVENGTILSQCLEKSQTTNVASAREAFILSRSRQANALTVLATSMTTSDGDIVGTIVWFNRRDTEKRRFQRGDEWAAGYFGQFAAVSQANTMRMQNMAELRAEMNLQSVPDVQLGRIRSKGGWATVRRLRKHIPRLVAEAEMDARSMQQRPSICVNVEEDDAIINFDEPPTGMRKTPSEGMHSNMVSTTNLPGSTNEGSGTRLHGSGVHKTSMMDASFAANKQVASAVRNLSKSLFAKKNPHGNHALHASHRPRSLSVQSGSSEALSSRAATAAPTPKSFVPSPKI